MYWYFLSMILPALSRSMRSMGWMTRQRTRTTSPALMLDGSRSRTLPMSDMLAPAPADGHLHLALDLQQRAVALLDDGPHIARLAQPDIGAHVGLAGIRREHGPGDDGNAIPVGDDVDVLDVALRRHRRVDLDRDRHHRAVLGDQRDVELDHAAAVLHGLAAEHPLERRVDRFVLAEPLRAGGPRRQRHAAGRRHPDGTEYSEHRSPRHPRRLCHR